MIFCEKLCMGVLCRVRGIIDILEQCYGKCRGRARGCGFAVAHSPFKFILVAGLLENIAGERNSLAV